MKYELTTNPTFEPEIIHVRFRPVRRDDLMKEPAEADFERPDERACRLILSGQQTVRNAGMTLSTSEIIVLALAFGRPELLPRPHKDFRSAWRRLDSRQRSLVDEAARARWKGKDEGGVH